MRDTLKTMSERQPSRHKKGLRFWLSRGLLGLGLLLVALLLAGASYQAIATRADARNYPPPSRLVDVGGYQLHIHCLARSHWPSYWGAKGMAPLNSCRICLSSKPRFHQTVLRKLLTARPMLGW